MIASLKFHRLRVLGWMLAILGTLCISASGAERPVSFNRDIRPLLSENCLKCHGGVKEAGKLNLQFLDRALKGGGSGLPAIVPVKPEASELIKRLVTKDEDDRMPKKGPPLKAAQIALFRQWIAEGAHWEKHWAYEPPQSDGKTIDATVKAHLKREKLSLSPKADRWILARRTALDLTGVPAPLEQVEAFVKDTSPHAYERWVDGLLASPAYGERWAAVWLDLARYADSRGYEKDGFRDMWRYRDWVIDAFNSDKPYDQFLTEQLAGDLLPKPTEDQLIATAFHRNTQSNDEGGVDHEEYRTYAVLDRLNTTFEVMQGTTIGCVQCHGHPYDPFVHNEYYQLLAYFNNTADVDGGNEAPTEKFYRLADNPKAVALKKQEAEDQKPLEAELARAENRQAFDDWLREMRFRREPATLTNATVSSTHGKFKLAEKGQVLLEGAAPDGTTITVDAAPAPGEFQVLSLEALPDDSLPQHGPGTGDGGNFVLSQIDIAVITPDGNAEAPLEIDRADATHEQDGFAAETLLKSAAKAKKERPRGWAIGGGTGKAQTIRFHLAKPHEITGGMKLRITLACEDTTVRHHILGSFGLAVGPEEPADKLPKPLRLLLSKDPASWNSEERAKLERHFFMTNPNLEALYQKVDRDRDALAALPICNLPIMQELTGNAVRTTRVFHRGNWMDKEEVVQPMTPAILNPWHSDYPANRLGLARWLTNGENPLTARVQVNRIWEQLFGIGLVETVEDFGTQGDHPIYQDLLDDLAVRFQTEYKWSQKKLLREIVLSEVYRQSSKTSKTLLERDPANRLLARGPRFRLTSEQLRDQALEVSGILCCKMFGPPVMPYQPPGMWATPYEGRDWVNANGDDAHRRALYTFIRRSATYPSFLTFDAPSREFCLARRTRTNTPLQALDLLDDPVFFEAADGLA